ncbi:MAG TPA: sulfotransferase domain-containing protein, partial [Actinomycetota bacterium]|nr:sulfotransferase domain-containing protein [Actinomycetota bacterium]
MSREHEARPAIAHITHPKAGSQWIRRILMDCVPDLVVPTVDQLVANPAMNPSWDFLAQPVMPGRVYPALYLPKDHFDAVEGVESARRFLVIRDLRDSLVSGYFSIRYSHPTDMAHVAEMRAQLETLSFEDGLILLFDGFCDLCAAVQGTWMESGDPLLRYEDLLLDDVKLLEEVLLDYCGLPVDRALFRDTVERNRFENLSGGRRLGEEDRTSHFRRGLPGDWRNHFTPRVTELFKRRFGDVLIYAGYEDNKD